jgi:hypothetical protein
MRTFNNNSGNRKHVKALQGIAGHCRGIAGALQGHCRGIAGALQGHCKALQGIIFDGNAMPSKIQQTAGLLNAMIHFLWRLWMKKRFM